MHSKKNLNANKINFFAWTRQAYYITAWILASNHSILIFCSSIHPVTIWDQVNIYNF